MDFFAAYDLWISEKRTVPICFITLWFADMGRLRDVEDFKIFFRLGVRMSMREKDLGRRR